MQNRNFCLFKNSEVIGLWSHDVLAGDDERGAAKLEPNGAAP